MKRRKQLCVYLWSCFLTVSFLLTPFSSLAVPTNFLPKQVQQATSISKEAPDNDGASSQTSPLTQTPSKKAKSEGVSSRVIEGWIVANLSTFQQLSRQFNLQLIGYSHWPQLPGNLDQRLRQQQPQTTLGHLLLVLLLSLLGAAVSEYLFRKIGTLAFTGPDPAPKTKFHRIAGFIQITAGNLLSVAVFCYSCTVFYFLLYPFPGPTTQILAIHILKSAMISRIAERLLWFLLQPRRPQYRFVPFSDQTATLCYRWLLFTSVPIILLSGLSAALKNLAFPQGIFLSLVGTIILLTFGLAVFFILHNRTRVQQAIQSSEENIGSEKSSFILTFAQFWHIPALLGVTALASIWEIRLLNNGGIYFGKILFTCTLLLLFYTADYWIQRLFQIFANHNQCQPSPEDPQCLSGNSVSTFLIQHLAGTLSRLRLVYRFLLLAFFLFILLSLWDVKIALGQFFTLSALLVITILLASYLGWQIFSSWIDSKITEELPPQEEMDEGGRGGSRQGTLLLLAKKAALALLLICSSLLLLYAMGIDIIPIIAGAGIIGLAISFGAQSLVADIFAGIFFLIDDAFRVGDYVDCQGVTGTVEHISLRSLRLRHHRGMVHTIPFGKIGSVTNYSRDYIIMKLDLRVRYETNVEKVRKIVKRIYQDLQQDEEFGPKLLGKLKSQGVREMDDSAMIMRIKFTTRPGDQFILRKEVYRRIQEAFKEHSIEFAHRNVTVYMPPEESSPISSQQEHLARSAAASRAIQDDTATHQEDDDSP